MLLSNCSNDILTAANCNLVKWWPLGIINLVLCFCPFGKDWNVKEFHFPAIIKRNKFLNIEFNSLKFIFWSHNSSPVYIFFSLPFLETVQKTYKKEPTFFRQFSWSWNFFCVLCERIEFLLASTKRIKLSTAMGRTISFGTENSLSEFSNYYIGYQFEEQKLQKFNGTTFCKLDTRHGGNLVSVQLPSFVETKPLMPAYVIGHQTPNAKVNPE